MKKTLALAALAVAAVAFQPGSMGTAEAKPVVSAKAVPHTSAVQKVARRAYVVRHRVYRPVYRPRPWRPVYVYRPWARPYYYYRPAVTIGVPLYAGYSYRTSCAYSYRKWKATGSRYWRNRYYRCRGW
jgi:hypothetical protein